MTLQLVKTALLAAIVSTSFPAFAGSDNSYYWIHPKLGQVKVQKAVPTAPAASAAVAAPPQAKLDAEQCKPRFWLAPKGDLRRVVPKECRA